MINNDSKDITSLMTTLYNKLDDNENKDDNEFNDKYYLIYQTPDEIFNNYISGQPLEKSMKFFQLLGKAQPNNANLFWAKKIFHFILSYYEQFHSTKKLELDDIKYSLVLSNLIEQYNEVTADVSEQNIDIYQEGMQYFTDYLNIDPEDDLDTYMDKGDIIDLHEDVASLIISYFELNENVKEILLKMQKEETNNPYDDVKIFNLIKNVIYDGQVTNEEAIELRQQINQVENGFHIFQETQTMFHKISHGLIFKDKNEFFSGVDEYIEYFLDYIGKPKDHVLTVDNKFILFSSDFYETIQENNIIANVFFQHLFTHYDEEIFIEFMKRYEIPTNMILVVTDEKNEKNYLFSLLEFVIFLNNFNIADSLIANKILPSNFKENITDIDKNESDIYTYHPYMNISLLNENQIIYLIKNNLIDENFEISYLEKTNDYTINNIHTVENNIFFYLAYHHYNEAFLLLHETAKSRNPDFETKNLLSHDNIDLLVYYVKSFQNYPDYFFNSNILDIFIAEKYNNILLPVGNNLITSLRKTDPLHMIAIIKHMQEIFESNIEPEQEIEKDMNIKLIIDDNYIEWFDKAKLEKHMLTIQREKDNSNKDYIKQMLSNNNNVKPRLTIKDESFFDKLEEQFPNFKEVIDFYKSQFRLQSISKKKHITPVLLLGDPGIGKTYFAQKLAEHLNTGYTFLDMASLTSNWIITGNNGSWKSAKQGKILEAMMKSSTASPVILLDELDKSRSGEHDPTMSLYQLLEEVNAKSFTDEFVDFQFDASNIIYIACANTIGNLSEPLQTRFKIINVPKPNSEQLNSIIQNIYKEAIQGSSLFNTELEDSIVVTLKNETLRSIKVMINDAVGNALLKYTSEEIKQLQNNHDIIDLTLENFKSPYKKQGIGFSRNIK